MISQFKQLEGIRRERAALEYKVKMGKISPLEFERGIEENNRAQYALAEPAYGELKAREAQLKSQRARILKGLVTAANVKKIDAGRMQEARKVIQRRIEAAERTGIAPSWKNIRGVVDAARELHDPALLQAALEAAIERPRPDTKHQDFPHIISDTQGYAKELDDMATSPEQRGFLALKAENEAEIAALYHERNEAQKQFVKGGSDPFAPRSIFDDVAAGVSLETYFADNVVEPQVRLNLSEDWDTAPEASQRAWEFGDPVSGRTAAQVAAAHEAQQAANQVPEYNGPPPVFTGEQ